MVVHFTHAAARQLLAVSVVLALAAPLCGSDFHITDAPPVTREEWIRLIDARIAEYQPPGDPAAAAPGFDPAVIAQGESAFMDSCTACHEAERALGRSKSFSEWLATVRRMAAKEGADVAPGDVQPIAAYLASRNPPTADPLQPQDLAAPQQSSLFATISPLWRGSNGESLLENPDFFVDAWVGADWQPTEPLRARVVACTSCHSDRNPSGGFALELVEASATIDLLRTILPCDDPEGRALQATLKAGRFIVPFGAFSAMSYPGVYRTVTNPLMFNMGRRVGPTGPLQPVLPMPYADEGLDIRTELRLRHHWNATMDIYAVNGLQGSDPLFFNTSRRYVDNNREPAIGLRATVGNNNLRFGGSVMTGNLANDGLAAITYKVAGADATLQLGEKFRFYFEYAIREDDSRFVAGTENIAYGIVAELEAHILHNLSLLARYDTLEHRHTQFGDASQERFTYGLNVTLPGGSWVAINHEHWIFDDAFDVDVLGIRWTATF